jgi:dihydrolipoamide dehydrogenase
VKDLIVIGGGPGGYVAAIRARQLGMQVALVEKAEMGGTCLNRGCIPTKAYYKNAQVLNTLHRAGDFNIEIDSFRFNLEKAKNRKDKIVDNLVLGINKLVKANGVEIINGEASIIDNQTVAVNGTRIKAYNILIASGSETASLPIKGIDLDGVLSSDDILDITEIPEKLAIIGGGVIGLEFAGIFSAFGSEVVIFEYLPRILNGLDGELGKRMGVFVKRQKTRIYANTSVEAIQRKGNRLEIQARDKKGPISWEADLVLAAGGRKPYTRGLNLEEVGIERDKNGFIKVDENYTTSVQNVYAIGDVIGGQMLAHVASEEGIAAVEKMAGIDSRLHYHAVPSCIFTFPEIASVGMSEEDARGRNIDYKIGRFQFAANGKAVTLGEIDGMVKVIADSEDVIIGIHIIGPHASDLILEGTLIVKNHLKTSEIPGTIHPHPTLGEALIEAILDVKKQAIHLAPKR